jgi:formylglycine-generating enzyme required for sulfatase activity
MEMSGNVWEWCDTSYVEDLARLLESDNTGEFRVLRGGSFFSDPRWLRSTVRNWFTPVSRDNDVGFRVSRTRIGF